MRTFFVLVCSFALVCAVRGNTKKGDAQSSKHPSSSGKPIAHTPHAQAQQHRSANVAHPAKGNPQVHTQAPQQLAHPGVHPARVPAGGHAAQIGQPGHPQPQGGRPQTATAVQAAAPPLTKEQQAEVDAQSQGFRSAEQYRKWKETGRLEIPKGVATSGVSAGEHEMTPAGSGAVGSHTGVHPFPSRHFDLPNPLGPGIKNVKFQPGSHIPECEKWRDSRYNAFRNYTATWHDADWWRSHHSRIVFVLGGWYYRHGGYWFPAWGYHSEAVYAYDGPIYAYNDLAPDQVVANVQATLQELGYYHGPINGYLDSATGAAIANYQRDHGLYTTSAIDEPTLVALGMA
jgi:Putative peptidoglycan binding domain